MEDRRFRRWLFYRRVRRSGMAEPADRAEYTERSVPRTIPTPSTRQVRVVGLGGCCGVVVRVTWIYFLYSVSGGKGRFLR